MPGDNATEGFTGKTESLSKQVVLGYNDRRSGRGSARLECAVRVREVGGSNPPAPTHHEDVPDILVFI